MTDSDTAATVRINRVNSRSGKIMQYPVHGTEAIVPHPSSYMQGGIITASEQEIKRKTGVKFEVVSVLFLAVIAALTVVMCIGYLRMKEVVTAQNTANEKLESKLQDLKSENDALLENVNMAVDWNKIKEAAISDLGMKYATEQQIVWYNTDDSGYVTQYCDVPES